MFILFLLCPDLSPPDKKKARKNLTLDLSPGKLDGWLKKHVHFDDIVLVKVGEKQRMVLLKGH